MKNFAAIAALLLGTIWFASTANAQIFVASYGGGTIGEYGFSGETINSSFISGVTNPTSLTEYGDAFYVTSTNGYPFNGQGLLQVYPGTGGSSGQVLLSHQLMPSQVSVYGGTLYIDNAVQGTDNNSLTAYPINGTTLGPGTIISSSLPSVGSSFALTPDGNNFLVPDFYFGQIAEVPISGGAINPGFITGLAFPSGLAFSGNNLFVLEAVSGSVVEYTMNGGIVSAGTTIVSGLTNVGAIAAAGDQIFVTTNNTSTTNGSVAEFTVSNGTVVSQNLSFITGLNEPGGIYVMTTAPEPTSMALLGFGLLGLAALGKMARNRVRPRS